MESRALSRQECGEKCGQRSGRADSLMNDRQAEGKYGWQGLLG